MDNNSSLCFITVRHVPLASLFQWSWVLCDGVHKKCSPAICLSFPNSEVDRVLPSPRWHIWMTRLCICRILLLPCASCPPSHPVLHLSAQRASVSETLSAMILQGHYLSSNTHMQQHLPGSISPPLSKPTQPTRLPASLPNTAQSRNICLSTQWELYSHTQVGTCFHFFRSYVAIVQLLPHFRSRLYIIFWSCCLFAQILEPKPIFFLGGSTARLSHIQGWFLQGIKPGML